LSVCAGGIRKNGPRCSTGSSVQQGRDEVVEPPTAAAELDAGGLVLLRAPAHSQTDHQPAGGDLVDGGQPGRELRRPVIPGDQHAGADQAPRRPRRRRREQLGRGHRASVLLGDRQAGLPDVADGRLQRPHEVVLHPQAGETARFGVDHELADHRRIEVRPDLRQGQSHAGHHMSFPRPDESTQDREIVRCVDYRHRSR
jgi:hypothetical protein